jgi:hypothetical protein
MEESHSHEKFMIQFWSTQKNNLFIHFNSNIVDVFASFRVSICLIKICGSARKENSTGQNWIIDYVVSTQRCQLAYLFNPEISGFLDARPGDFTHD